MIRELERVFNSLKVCGSASVFCWVKKKKISKDICVAGVARFCVQLLLERGSTTLSSQNP